VTEERKPPRYPELVRVHEDDSPPTDRVPLPMPPPQRLGLKPIQGRGPSYVEIAAAISATQQQLASMASMQNKMARQLDGHGVTINQRFDVFHQELAMLRATVLGDHAPRLDKVEQSTGAKVARGGGIGALILILAPMLADALPKYRHIIEVLFQ
jgi:hypothetical protein